MSELAKQETQKVGAKHSAEAFTLQSGSCPNASPLQQQKCQTDWLNLADAGGSEAEKSMANLG